MGRNRVVDIPSIKIQPRCAPTAAKERSASNRPSPGGVGRFDHLGFRCTANPGWRGRNACAFFGRSTPGYLLKGLQPEEPGTGGT